MTTLNKYQELEESFFKKINNYFNSRLIFYCVTGSTARIQNINDWSDIDIVMVFDSISKHDLESIQSTIDKLNSPIKIGITSYSKEDIEKKLIDPKTGNLFRNIKSGRYTPRIDSIDFVKTLNLTDSYVLELNRVEFAKDMHSFRRELMRGDDGDERKIYKLLTYMMRVLLFYSGHLVDGYFETWEKVLGLGLVEKDYIVFPAQIINDTVPRQERIAKYYYLYAFLEKNIDNLKL